MRAQVAHVIEDEGFARMLRRGKNAGNQVEIANKSASLTCHPEEIQLIPIHLPYIMPVTGDVSAAAEG
ncbi:hypothetical protein [Methylobrevis pamukkalensis]|nr:hypothetical protein [Methylobrevis pamukkalensis]